MPIIDLTGQKIGQWTVLYHIKGSNPSKWFCRCSCGTEKEVNAQSLRRGESLSCGCLRKKQNNEKLLNQVFGKLKVIKRDLEEMNKHKSSDRRNYWLCQCECGEYRTLIKDITNQKFGLLTALYPTKNREFGSIMWHCQCDCGNTCEKAVDALTSGQTKSCGCLVSRNLEGQKFGKILVLEKTNQRLRKNIIYKCRCDCGTIFYTTGVQLSKNYNSTLSCGCTLSKGEMKIISILQKYNISYKTQHTFETCRFKDTNALAKFDFYIDNKYLIEFDGKQHFSYTNTGWNTEEHFIKTQEHDIYKNQWCKENNIPLIRIPYTKLDTLCLEDLLLETSTFKI